MEIPSITMWKPKKRLSTSSTAALHTLQTHIVFTRQDIQCSALLVIFFSQDTAAAAGECVVVQKIHLHCEHHVIQIGTRINVSFLSATDMTDHVVDSGVVSHFDIDVALIECK